MAMHPTVSGGPRVMAGVEQTTLMRTGPPPDRYGLRPLISKSDWSMFHRIRKSVLWDARGLEGYDPEHPDDRNPNNHPFLLWFEGEPVGVIRVDVALPYGILRRVAIAEAVQRRGHGTQMVRLAEEFARSAGCTIVASHVDREAIGFYERLGYASTRADDELWMEKPL